MPGTQLTRYGIDAIGPVYRVGPTRFTPMSTPPRALQGRGRFDDPTIDLELDAEGYAILYAATEAKTAFLEAMYQFRTPLSRLKEIANEVVLDTQERDSLFSHEGVVSERWISRSALHVGEVVLAAPLFDLTNSAAVQDVREQLALVIYSMGLDDLDFGELLGSNRTLTQGISRWIWSLKTSSGEPLFSGIRYRSRFDPECICLALYQDRYTIKCEVQTQHITPETPGFAEAAATLHLKIS